MKHIGAVTVFHFRPFRTAVPLMLTLLSEAQNDSFTKVTGAAVRGRNRIEWLTGYRMYSAKPVRLGLNCHIAGWRGARPAAVDVTIVSPFALRYAAAMVKPPPARCCSAD